MSRPRKVGALTGAERARLFRLRHKSVTETLTVTETLDGSFCEWFPWAKGCSLDLMQRTAFNVVRPGHHRFVCVGDPLHPSWWPKSKPASFLVR